MIPTPHRPLRVGSILLALAAIAYFFYPRTPPRAGPDPEFAASTAPLVRSVPGVADIPALFAGGATAIQTADVSTEELELVGLAGRLPDDVEALVRLPEGNTVSLRIGESVSDWTLASVAADRAVFSRGGEQIILAMEPVP